MDSTPDVDQTELETFTNESIPKLINFTVTAADSVEPPRRMFTSVQRLVMLSVIMSVALLGNFLILLTLTCTRYRVRIGRTYSRVSIFILNLAVSDLTVCLVTMPGEMIFIVFGEWVLGAISCKLILYGQIVALMSTIFNLMAMSYDRYLAICQPLHFRNGFSKPRHMIAMAWISAFFFAIPQLFIFKQVQTGVHSDGTPVYDCASHGYTAWWQRRLYFSCLTLLVLVIPATVITYCYVSIVGVVWRQGKFQTVVASRSSVVSLRKSGTSNKTLSRAKLRTIKLTLCIILTFVTCWVPYFVVHNLRVHSHYQIQISVAVREFVATFALINSALNPIVYGCFNLRVKKALHESCCVQRPNSAMDYILGSTIVGHPRNHLNSECSSSCVEETIVHASVGSSPAGSAKFRVIHCKLNGGGGGGSINSAKSFTTDHSRQSSAAAAASATTSLGSGEHAADIRRGNSCHAKSYDIYELKQRPSRKDICS